LALFVLLVITAGKTFAQNDSVAKAVLILQDQNLPQDKRVKQALEIIDRAILHSQSANNAYAWYIRGYVYKEYYKLFEAQNKKSKTRDDAVVYLKKALKLDSTKEYEPTIKQNLKYIGSTYYNDAGSSLDATNYKIALEDYNKFKDCMLAAEPNYNIKAREIEFKNALATVYTNIFRSNIKTNSEYFGKTEEVYKQVLALDTNNWGGNYNLAMLYYNYGVDVINQMEVTEDILQVDNIQEEARSLFKKSLPYALKAYSLNKQKKEILICLQGIYFSLYEFEKSDEFKAKLERMEKEK